MSDSCYYCGGTASSLDHVPPKVFFPVPKDVAGVDYRKNLITVPACDQHNNPFSKDDEYIAYLVATSCTNNTIGTAQAITKAFRALVRSGGLANRMLEDAARVELDGKPTLALQADIEAFCRVMTRTARGLHFKETGRLIPHANLFAVCPQMLRPDNPKFAEWTTLFDGLSKLQYIAGVPCDNPDVFTYLRYFDNTPRGDIAVFRFRFYGGFVVFVGPSTK